MGMRLEEEGVGYVVCQNLNLSLNLLTTGDWLWAMGDRL